MVGINAGYGLQSLVLVAYESPLYPVSHNSIGGDGMDAKFKAEVKRRAIELVAGEVPAILSSWALTMYDPVLGPGDAVDTLAVWAHLQRFEESDRPSEIWERLDRLVKREAESLCEQAVRGLNPPAWLEEAKRLAVGVDNALSREERQAVDSTALALFVQLDEADLALWATIKLSSRGFDVLADLSVEVFGCLAFFHDNLSRFLAAKAYAMGLWNSYSRRIRMDEEVSLRMRTWKHRALIMFEGGGKALLFSPQDANALLDAAERLRKGK